MNLIEVEPIGTRDSFCFVDGVDENGGRVGSSGMIPVPIYPPPANGLLLFTQRMECDVTVRNAAKLLGISCVKLCHLEHGRLTMSDEDWEALLKIVNTWEARAGK